MVIFTLQLVCSYSTCKGARRGLGWKLADQSGPRPRVGIGGWGPAGSRAQLWESCPSGLAGRRYRCQHRCSCHIDSSSDDHQQHQYVSEAGLGVLQEQDNHDRRLGLDWFFSGSSGTVPVSLHCVLLACIVQCPPTLPAVARYPVRMRGHSRHRTD